MVKQSSRPDHAVAACRSRLATAQVSMRASACRFALPEGLPAEDAQQLELSGTVRARPQHLALQLDRPDVRAINVGNV